MLRILSFVCFLMIFQGLWAQTCTQKLNLAEDDYEAGRLLGIPNQLKDCLLEGGFSSEEAIRAKKLLTLVYIFTDQEAKAEIAMIDLLHADPEHRLNPQVDPAELFFLYNQFRVAPIFRVSLRVGANFSRVNVTQENSTRNLLFEHKFYNRESSSGLGVGYMGELSIEREISRGIEAILGLQVRVSEYNVEAVEQLQEDLTVTPLRTLVTNQQTYGRIPLSFRYTQGYHNRDQILLPYVLTGISYDFLLSAKYINAERSPGTTFNASDLDLINFDMVNTSNFSVFGGVGLKIRVDTHFLTVEARYDRSLMHYTNPDNRFNNQTVTWDLAYVEDDLAIDVLSFSLGWIHSIYNPKKLKEYRK